MAARRGSTRRIGEAGAFSLQIESAPHPSLVVQPMTGIPVLPPETVEGWFALHQLFTVDRAALRAQDPAGRRAILDEARATLDALQAPPEGGWSRVVPLVGSSADVMLV